MDRSIYEPGDTVRFAGWLRRAAGTGHDLDIPGAQQVMFTARDPRGAELATDTIDIKPNGRVEGSFVIPPEANAGPGQIHFVLHEDRVELRTSAMYQIQAVRRPNFDVAMEVDAGPYLPGSRVDATLNANYFTGGGVPNAETRWLVRSGFASYTPPGVVDYSFGMLRFPTRRPYEPVTRVTRTDAAGMQRLSVALDSVRPHRAMQLIVQATVTDLDRQGRSASQTLLVHPAAVYVGLRTAARFVRAGEPVTIDALVVDIEGRAAAGRPVVMRAMRQHARMEAGRLVVDESERGRCTLQSSTDSVRCVIGALPAGDYIIVADVTDVQGRRSTSELAVRIAGEAIPAGARGARDSVAVTADRAVYEPGDTARVLIETSLRTGEALLSLRRAGVLETHAAHIANGIATVALPIRDLHVPNMTVHAAVIAPDGRTADGATSVAITPITRRLTVEVNPEAPQVAPGAATSVTVIVRDDAGRPVPNADVVLSGIDEALLALSMRKPGDPVSELYPHSGAGVFDRSLRVHSIRPFTTRGGVINGVVIDAVTGRPLRGVWVETSKGTGAWTGTDGRYQIEGVQPGRHIVHARMRGYVSAPVDSVILTRNGAARAHFAMLTQYAVLSAARGRDLELMRREADFAGRAAALDELVVAAAPAPPPPPGAEPVLRTVFTPVAAFVTDARTGADGSVTIPVNVPHSLTRYRLRAVAAHNERRFGVGESTFTARRPLMVRAMPPRFLNRDDRFDLTVLVENRSNVVQDVEIAVRAVNARLTGPNGQRVRVPAGDRVEVRFGAVAGEPGSATFQVAASGDTADAAEVTVPVLLPAVTETFAVYGHLDNARAVSYPLRLPTGSLPDQTRVDIGFSTTAVQGLRDALFFLIDCWFDLPEVSASRILALSALRDAPAATPWPVAAIDTMIRADITRLARAQLLNGGWSVWAARFDADPFITVHAAHALARAHTLGHVVPARTLANATRFLELLSAPTTSAAGTPAPPSQRYTFPADYPLQARHAVQAYALDVRRRLGHDVAEPAAALLHAAGVNALPAEALAWLLPALARDARFANDAADIRRELDARTVRSAGTAAVVSPYDAGAREMLYSPRRTDAVVLAALVEDGSTADALIAAMARGLMAHRVRGRWANTQENAFAVAALADYLAVGEATEPALTARAWTGTRLAAQHDFHGRSDDRAELMVPADSIGEPGATANVTMSREGAGRVYYRVALRHALAGLTPPLARGFAVTRSYEAVDDPADVQRAADGNWRIRLGARVRVRLNVDNSGPRYHVAARRCAARGSRSCQSGVLAGTGAARPPVATTSPTDRTAFLAEHVNVRADRFEAFRLRLNPGRYELTYIAIATTPGNFAAPAPRAEEMYAPETFGRGAAARVIVEER